MKLTKIHQDFKPQGAPDPKAAHARLTGTKVCAFVCRFQAATPLKINMEHKHGGLEDLFWFLMGDF